MCLFNFVKDELAKKSFDLDILQQPKCMHPFLLTIITIYVLGVLIF